MTVSAGDKKECETNYMRTKFYKTDAEILAKCENKKTECCDKARRRGSELDAIERPGFEARLEERRVKEAEQKAKEAENEEATS